LDSDYVLSKDEPTNEVDAFLDCLSDKELVGIEVTNPEYYGYPPLDESLPTPDKHSCNQFNTFIYAITSWHRVLYEGVDPKHLQPFLGYRPLDIVKKTLEHSTQMARMIIRTPLRKHLKSRAPFLNVTRLDEVVSTDPIFANCPSLHHGYLGAQVFYGLDSHCIDVYGFRSKGEFPRVYKDFIREQGAPSVLRRDNAKEEQSAEVLEIHRELYIKDQYSEPYNPQQNPVESRAINWLKSATHVLLDRRGAPDSAWYFAAKYLSEIHSICYDKKLGMSPRQKRTGITPDISAYLQFQFWEKVLYLDHEESWPSSKERTGYWVGVAHNVGDALTYWIFDDQSKWLLARSVVRPFRNNLRVRWDPMFAKTPIKHTAKNAGECMPLSENKQSPVIMDKYDLMEPDPEEHFFDPGIDVESSPVVPAEKEDPYKGNSKLRLENQDVPVNPEIVVPKPKKKVSYKDVKYPEVYIPPDTKNKVEVHKVPKEKPKNIDDPSNLRRSTRRTRWRGTKTTIAKLAISAASLLLPTHIIAEPARAIMSVDATKVGFIPPETRKIDKSEKMEELRAYLTTLDRLNALLNPEVEDERWAIHNVEKHIVKELSNGDKNIHCKVRYKDGDTAYHTLDCLRMHDPMVAAMYGLKNNLIKHPEWKWIHHYIEANPVRHALTQVFRVTVNGDGEIDNNPQSTKAPNKREKKYKFGVEVPANVKHALQLDQENGNTGWKEAIALEIKQLNDYQTFIVVPDNQPMPRGYKRIPHHIVFDVKFDGRLKARLVAGGHRTPDVPKDESFSTVVSMEAVRLGFILSHMQGKLVCAGDVGNAYLYSRTREKVYIVAGPEFGPELEGKRLIVDKALYGLKTSAVHFHKHLSVKLRKMGFRPSKADPDLWIRKLKNGLYEYVARFVDDVIAFSTKPMEIMEELKKSYIMKGVGKPQYYLGGDIVDLGPEWKKEGITTSFSAQTYIQNCLPKLANMCGKETFP